MTRVSTVYGTDLTVEPWSSRHRCVTVTQCSTADSVTDGNWQSAQAAEAARRLHLQLLSLLLQHASRRTPDVCRPVQRDFQSISACLYYSSMNAVQYRPCHPPRNDDTATANIAKPVVHIYLLAASLLDRGN